MEMFKIIRACLLVLVLACSARAGEMQNGAPLPTTPPADPQVVVEEPATTEAGDDQTFDLTDTLTEAALSVLDNVLALL